MEILFKNSFIKTEEWIKEVNRYMFFKRPRFVVCLVLCLLVLSLGIYKLLFLHIFDILFLVVPICWFTVTPLLYFKTNTITAKRINEIYGNNFEVVYEVTKDGIKQTNSNGAQQQIYYDIIKKGYQTRNYILLHSKANILYAFKKDGFSIGDADGFLTFLRNKGIKIK